MAWEFHHSSGAAQGIGPMAEIGPGGAHAGRVVGLIPALHFIGDVGAPAVTALQGARKRAKDFNDAETFRIAGVRGGRPVRTGGRWRPSQPGQAGGARPMPPGPGPGGGGAWPWGGPGSPGTPPRPYGPDTRPGAPSQGTLF